MAARESCGSPSDREDHARQHRHKSDAICGYALGRPSYLQLATRQSAEQLAGVSDRDQVMVSKRVSMPMTTRRACPLRATNRAMSDEPVGVQTRH